MSIKTIFLSFRYSRINVEMVELDLCSIMFKALFDLCSPCFDLHNQKKKPNLHPDWILSSLSKLL
jgi:hypothetical protein